MAFIILPRNGRTTFREDSNFWIDIWSGTTIAQWFTDDCNMLNSGCVLAIACVNIEESNLYVENVYFYVENIYT